MVDIKSAALLTRGNRPRALLLRHMSINSVQRQRIELCWGITPQPIYSRRLIHLAYVASLVVFIVSLKQGSTNPKCFNLFTSSFLNLLLLFLVQPHVHDLLF